MEEEEMGYLRGKEVAEMEAMEIDDGMLMEVDEDGDVGEEIQLDIARFLKERETVRTLYRGNAADNDTINSSRSLYSTDIVYHDIHGRRYCGDYYMPCDEEEQKRIQWCHIIYEKVLGGRLTTVPLDSPTKILDIGTGCGDWAISMGDTYPLADVIGTDIAAIQHKAVPRNVFFEIDEAEEEFGWTYAEDSFDLIHFRSMRGAFKDWKHIYKETFRALQPGGWVEVLDFDDPKAVLSLFPNDAVTVSWLRAIDEGSRRAGTPRGVTHLEHERFTEMGFEDVTSEEYSIPLGYWPVDPEAKLVARLFYLIQMVSIEALSLRMLSEQLGWDIDEIQRVCNSVASELSAVCEEVKEGEGMTMLLRVVKARKPMPKNEAEAEESGSSITTRNDNLEQGFSIGNGLRQRIVVTPDM